ncbi:Carboxypeptidase-related protein [Caulobacter sp. RHG1]|nr:Carboxypeptidase-related protein [Caulobacter sp. RHG1]
MKSRLLASALAVSILTLPAASALAQAAPAEAILQPVDHPAVVTRHVGVFNGQKLAYTATVAPTLVNAEDPKAGARLVSFAYTRDGADPAKRPVLFLFNGGPIVPSMYLHLGGLGPKRISFPDDISAPPSSFKLIDNTYSPLDAADLVFVDPASTGFSRALPGVDPRAFYSVKADAQQVAGFIRQWIKANGREGAPIYVMGESYGTNRAAEVAGLLAEGDAPLPLAGVMLYGQAVNIIEYVQRPANVTSYVASLPTLAAIGWYHGKAKRDGRTLQAFLADANAWAKGPYLSALYQGSALGEAERQKIAAELEAYTGLSAAWYLANDLKISKERYRVELLKDQKLVLGRADARYTAPLTEKGGAVDASDVLSKAIVDFFAAYRRDALKVTWPEPYVGAAPLKGLNDWGWGEGTSPFADWPYYQGVGKMLKLNPKFRVFVGNGYYDTQTTMGAAELLTTQSGWDPARVTLKYYDGGHMGYSVDATAKGIADDLRTWIAKP